MPEGSFALRVRDVDDRSSNRSTGAIGGRG